MKWIFCLVNLEMTVIARGQEAETEGGADPETGTKRSLKTDPYPNLVKYSPSVLNKKTQVLDIN